MDLTVCQVSAGQGDRGGCPVLPASSVAHYRRSHFNVLDIFIRENGLAWDRCVGLCTDGAQAMTGRERGLAARVQQVAPLVKWTHCMVHREALAAKKMPVLFDSVLNQSVKMINLIKSRPLNSRLFGVLCQEMGSGHE